MNFIKGHKYVFSHKKTKDIKNNWVKDLIGVVFVATGDSYSEDNVTESGMGVVRSWCTDLTELELERKRLINRRKLNRRRR